MKPIYMTGMYRSGTSLVTRILDNHPDLSVTYDSVHFMRFSYGKYDPVSKKENYTAIVHEIHERILKRWKMVFDKEAVVKVLDAMDNVEYRDVYDELMKNLMLKEKPHARWGEKTCICWGQIPNFLNMFPDGKVIHIVRDPRDTLTAFKKMTYEPGYCYLDTAFAALNSFHSILKYQQKFSKERYYCLRYESLVEEPKEELKRLSEFLEIDYDEKCLDTATFRDRKGDFWSGDSSFDESMEGISTKPIGRWRDKLSNLEVYFLEMICREQMVNFGYKLEGKMLSQDEWGKLYEILDDPFIKERYDHFMKTGDGLEAYPSDPIKRAIEDMKRVEQGV